MKVLFYSHNSGKQQEISAFFRPLNLQICTPRDMGIEANIEETGTTFVENAILKARDGAKKTGLPCIADDSGLVVDCLNGDPGLNSAHYAGLNATSADNIIKLLDTLTDFPAPYNAYFFCCLVFIQNANDPCPLIVEGRMHGQILDTPAGQDGFGYDPVFYLPQLKKTCAQLSCQEKNRYSHRGQALRLLYEKIKPLFT